MQANQITKQLKTAESESQTPIEYTIESVYPSLQIKAYLEELWKSTLEAPSEQNENFRTKTDEKPKKKTRNELLRSIRHKAK